MDRRLFLTLSAAAVACRKVDPFTALGAPAPLEERLRQLAGHVAAHRWDAVMAMFDEEHRRFQHRIYFDPDYNEAPPDPDDPAEQVAFRDWYLRNSLGLFYADNSLDSIDEVLGITYTGLEEPFGTEGPQKVLFDVHATQDRTRTGWVFIDRQTLMLSSSMG